MVTSTQDCVWYYGENKIIKAPSLPPKELKEMERNENNIFIHYTILFCCMLSSDNMKLGLGSEAWSWHCCKGKHSYTSF